MTIGPDPMTMTLLMSSRFGTAVAYSFAPGFFLMRMSAPFALDLERVGQHLLDVGAPVGDQPAELGEAVGDADAQPQAVLLGEAARAAARARRPRRPACSSASTAREADALVHVVEVGGDQRRHARVLEPGQVGEELDLLGRVALVAGLVAREHLGDDVDPSFLRVDDLVAAARSGHEIDSAEIMYFFSAGSAASPFSTSHLEDPLLLLLVLDGLVVHHAEAAHQRVERLRRAVVAQRLHRLHAIGRLRVLVDGARGVFFARALRRARPSRTCRETPWPCRAGVYTRRRGSSMAKTLPVQVNRRRRRRRRRRAAPPASICAEMSQVPGSSSWWQTPSVPQLYPAGQTPSAAHEKAQGGWRAEKQPASAAAASNSAAKSERVRTAIASLPWRRSRGRPG